MQTKGLSRRCPNWLAPCTRLLSAQRHSTGGGRAGSKTRHVPYAISLIIAHQTRRFRAGERAFEAYTYSDIAALRVHDEGNTEASARLQHAEWLLLMSTELNINGAIGSMESVLTMKKKNGKCNQHEAHLCA